MSFTRTSSGLGNQFMFYNVDAIVFTEGGDVSWTFEDIRNNEFNENSLDILFWKKLFAQFKSELNIKFKAVGSKTTVKSIALEIQSNNLKTVIAAMDSEFDQLHGVCVNHPNVLYTHGYSWENDVWNQDLVISLLQNISGEEIDNEIIDNCMSSFEGAIIEGVYADAHQFGLGDTFLPRKGHLKCIDCRTNQSPSVLTEYIDQLFLDKGINRDQIREYGANHNIDVQKSCFGHLLNDFIFHLTRYYCMVELKIKTLHKDLMERFAINNFITHCSEIKLAYHKSRIINTLPNND